MILWLDFETRSRCDLGSKGAYNYAQDASTEVLCMSYAFDDDEVQTWRPGEPFPERVRQHKGQIRAHNAAFERLIFWYVLQINFELEQFYCTATQSRANCAPGKLEDVGRFASVDMKKDYRGAQLIRLLSIPQADGTFREDEGLMAEMVQYCEQDVRAMRAVSKALRDLSPEELADYHVNERINDRGVLVDMELCKAAMRYADDELVEIEQIVAEVTDGEVTSVRSPRMREWVLARVGEQARKLMTVYKDGEKKFSIDKTIRFNLLMLAEESPHEVPPDVAEVIQCADDLWASSVAKFSRLASLADDEDRRVRGAFVFAGGAATGRASSYGAQVHNFTRKVAPAPDEVRHALVRGHSIVPRFGKRVTDVLKGMLRPALVPARGHVLIVADWAAIEARMNPWLSNAYGAEDKLDLFRTGADVYKHNASRTFHAPVEAITKDQRQIGKVQELACFSAETKVLTSSGVKAIVDVQTSDLLWDGHQWVTHQGVISKGQRRTINVCGVEVTPDHLIRTNEIWEPAQRLASNRLILTRALATGSVNLPSWVQKYENKAHVANASFLFNALAGLRRTLSFFTTSSKAHQRAATLALKKHRVTGAKTFLSTPTPVLMTNIDDGCLTGYLLAKTDATTQKIEVIQTTAAGELLYTSLGDLTKPRSFDTCLRLMDGINQILSLIVLMSTKAMNLAIYGSSPNKRTKRIGEKFKKCNDTSSNLRPVFDILNSGSRNQFTILSDAGPLIVHNCGYGGSVGAFAAMGRVYGVALPESESRRMVDAWRRANPWAVTYWQALEGAYTRAMRNRGHEFSAGRVTYLFDGQHLWYMLPSGRVLCYPYAQLDGDGVSYAKAAWKPSADATEWPRARLWKGLACIAKGTPVLTHRGWIAIETVLADDLIWDGIAWVRHQGLAHQGIGRVNYVFAVAMTADHLVLTDAGWKRADQIKGHHRASCRLPDGYETTRDGWPTGHLADNVRLRADAGHEAGRLSQAGSRSEAGVMRVQKARAFIRGVVHAWNEPASCVRRLAVHVGSLSSAVSSSMEKLRRARHYRVSALARVVREFLGGHGAGVSARLVFGPYRQQRAVFAAELPVDNLPTASPQHAQLSLGRQPAWTNADMRTVRENGDRRHNASISRSQRGDWASADKQTGRYEEVFDILNCGPRHRFVVLGIDGKPLIVHNCENICQAAANDVLRASLRQLDNAVLHVHDEIVLEVPESDADAAAETLRRVMCEPPGWASGLPLEAEVNVMTRYGKG